ncbi:MAG: 50S ribosomal protein L24e [Halobacteriota archaeon]
MVETRTCDYSGEEIEPGTGTMYVKTDGTILHFKDSKAEKNYFLGREARDLEWTQAGRQARGKGEDE